SCSATRERARTDSGRCLAPRRRPDPTRRSPPGDLQSLLPLNLPGLTVLIVSKVAATHAPLLACTGRTTGELDGPSVSGSGKPCGLPARLSPLAFILTNPLVIHAVWTPWGVPSGSLYLSLVAKDPVQHGFERHTPPAGATASTMRRPDWYRQMPMSSDATGSTAGTVPFQDSLTPAFLYPFSVTASSAPFVAATVQPFR